MSDADTIYHPLFAPSESEEDPDEAPPDVQEILVRRKEPSGKFATAPRTFLANELLSLAALHSEYGGGEYELIARGSRKQIVRRVVYVLPGPPKPLFDSGEVEPPPKAPPVAATGMMGAMLGGGGEGGIMGLVMMMMQQMMAAQNAAAQNQSQMMMAFIQSMATGNQAQIAAAQENMNRQAERDARDKESQMAMLVKLTEARGAGNSTGGEESFFKGVEFMRHFSTQQIETLKTAAKGSGGSELDWESLLESGLQALQTFNAFKDLTGGGVQTPPAEIPS